ncbi:type II toxin-antitoxin system MqsR family toxin [Cupriavidus oxalaticus]|uniref:Type II toxin-antitoxin system MqsR family toxin n=1 Tax=Cupriavidus oxalaticus TaxID=96344 RepID=A0A5P3VJ16_9BURK|nr:type II toxin-antitoxin system MqsR family toxin [Cupriavidus oxalaticus]QEZ45382.1 type II toxin-antitoxin system MqsR family toxin [Cupriavidus oxalaticus]
MGKGTAHYPLWRVRELIAGGLVNLTTSAFEGARNMSLTRADVLDVVAGLQPADFYKSMTTYTDHTVWQDVYRPSTPYGSIYLKLTVVEKVLIMSFKAR